MSATRSGLGSIDDIELFVRIVERGTLAAAGASLDMSSPLVSRRLAALERKLGVRLVDRSSRMLVLTEHGRSFLARAESILRLVRETEAELNAGSAELRGTLRISLPTAAAESGIIADFVALFHKHSELSIEMHMSDRPVDVIGHGFDAALFLTDAPDRHPGDKILGQHPTSLTASPRYLDLAGRPTAPEELLKHRTVRAVSPRGEASDWVLMHEDGREITLPPAGTMFLSDDLRVAYTAIISGGGVGRMPVGYIAQGANRGKLELVLPQWRFRPILIMATLRRPDSARSGKVNALFDLALATLKRIDAYAVASPLENYYRDQVALSAKSNTNGIPARRRDDRLDQAQPLAP